MEDGRRDDPRLVGPSATVPVVVAGPVDGFDVTDASIGAALGLAVALPAVAAARLWQRINRRARTVGA